jgi:hypothetical protein
VGHGWNAVCGSAGAPGLGVAVLRDRARLRFPVVPALPGDRGFGRRRVRRVNPEFGPVGSRCAHAAAPTRAMLPVPRRTSHHGRICTNVPVAMRARSSDCCATSDPSAAVSPVRSHVSRNRTRGQRPSTPADPLSGRPGGSAHRPNSGHIGRGTRSRPRADLGAAAAKGSSCSSTFHAAKRNE